MLWDAIRKNSDHNVNVILGANFPVDSPISPLGMTSLHFAACSSTVDVMSVILNFQASVNVRDNVRMIYKFTWVV